MLVNDVFARGGDDETASGLSAGTLPSAAGLRQWASNSR